MQVSLSITETLLFSDVQRLALALRLTISAHENNTSTTGIDLLCDLLFIVDVPICFLTAKWVIVNQGREEWHLVSDLEILRHMYMWKLDEGKLPIPQFWIDLAGCVPWQVCVCACLCKCLCGVVDMVPLILKAFCVFSARARGQKVGV